MSVISLRLPDALEEKLAREAQRANTPRSEIARRAVAEYLERQERDRLLLDALQKLPDDLQQLISLKFFLNASNLDIAAALELTPSNVGVKVHRALKELRRRLEPEFFWSES